MPDKGHVPSLSRALGWWEKPGNTQDSTFRIRLSNLDFLESANTVLQYYNYDVTSYLNCSLGLLEYHVYYPFNTSIDKEITWSFLQAQVCLQNRMQSTPCEENDYMTRGYILWGHSQNQQIHHAFLVVSRTCMWHHKDDWTHSLFKILSHRSVSVI